MLVCVSVYAHFSTFLRGFFNFIYLFFLQLNNFGCNIALKSKDSLCASQRISQLWTDFIPWCPQELEWPCGPQLSSPDSHSYSIEGSDSFMFHLINTELAAASFHLTKWNFPGRRWRTPDAHAIPQDAVISPHRSCGQAAGVIRVVRRTLSLHSFPSDQQCLLQLMSFWCFRI